MNKVFRLIAVFVLGLFLFEVLEASVPFVRTCLQLRQSNQISFEVHMKSKFSRYYQVVKKDSDFPEKGSTKKLKERTASHHAVPQSFSTFENRMPISLWTPIFLTEILSPPLQDVVRPPNSRASI